MKQGSINKQGSIGGCMGTAGPEEQKRILVASLEPVPRMEVASFSGLSECEAFQY